MKEESFLYLKNNIPLQSIELDQLQYYDFVKSKKHEFIMNFFSIKKLKRYKLLIIGLIRLWRIRKIKHQ